MTKRPSFQFYPTDWQTDQGARLCSLAARGLWIDMLCLMHSGEPYGHLTTEGAPMRPDDLARLVGDSPAVVRKLLAELRAKGVYSVTDDGKIYSRRMVRDEGIREARAAGGHAGGEHGVKGREYGHKGGRPKKQNGGSDDDERGDIKPPLGENQKPPPSSSSSSSASQGSEANASADVSPIVDADKLAWSTIKLLLLERCDMQHPATGRFFGKLLADHGLEARDMLPAICSATINNTGDPKGYLSAAAAGISKRRAGLQLSPSQKAARSNIQ